MRTLPALHYWKSEAVKHFNPDAERHHFLVPVIDLALPGGWELNLGAGRCLSDRDDRWIVKSIVGYSFH